jgi:galactonate dehydratase
MKITDVKTMFVGNPWKNWLFVKLFTDEGITGIGEATNGAFRTMPVEAAVHVMKPLFIGMDPRNIQEILTKIHLGINLTTTPAICGIEQACWDILGKSLNVPVWRLLGGKTRPRIKAYANGWYRGPREPKFFAEAAKKVVAMGYKALKFDPFGDAYRFLERDEERLSLALVEAVREAVGESVDIMIEAHDRFSVSTAVTLGHKLAQYNPMWFETPVMSTDIDATIEVARRVPIPVASGERFSTLREIAQLVESKVISIVQPELVRIGGISGMIKAAAIAEAHESYIAPHNAQSPLCTVVNTHVGAVVPNVLIQECFDDTNVSWTKDVFTFTVAVNDGFIEVSDRPGLGIDLIEEVALRHPYQDVFTLRLYEKGWERRGE